MGRRTLRSTRSVRLRLETSTLPVGDETDFEMGNLQSELTVDLCVDVLVRPTRVRRASQGPQGHVVPLRGAARRQDLTVGYVLQSAAPAGSSPWFYRGVSSSPYTVHLCLGVSCEGSSIASKLRYCVASQVV